MYSFFKEANEFSVGRDFKQEYFKKLVYDKKVNYLKYLGVDHSGLVNPASLEHLTKNKENVYNAKDSSTHYSMSLKNEKTMITKRAANLEYIGKMNGEFENCRNLCKVPDSRLRNIHLTNKENQNCLTDCLNVRTELLNIKKPNNDEKVFIWLA